MTGFALALVLVSAVTHATWNLLAKRSGADTAFLFVVYVVGAVAYAPFAIAIVMFKDGSAVGVGAGQMSRVEAVQIAAHRAGDRGRGSVMASDAFFPFPDGLEEGIRAGVTAVIQPGGSMRDDQVIKAADEHGIAMVFTGTRHFRH